MTLNVNSNYLQPKTCLTKFIYDCLKCLEVFTIPPASKHLSNVNLKANIKFSQKVVRIIKIINIGSNIIVINYTVRKVTKIRVYNYHRKIQYIISFLSVKKD